MYPPNCDHCLRPAFTARIAKELLEQRRPINLIGKPGQGRGRLLEDLRQIDPAANRWLYADLKAHRHRFAGLLATLWVQTGLAGDPPSNLGDLVDRLTDDQRRVCLLLHHFDAILDNTEIGEDFDVAFLDGLNALKNRGISLLCVTEHAHSRYLMMEKSGERRVSTLMLEPEHLGFLSQTEIRSEIRRCLPGLDDREIDRLAARLLGHPQPLPFLRFVRGRIENGDADGQAFDERLRRWEKTFQDHHRGLTTADAARLPNWLIGWCRTLKCNRIKPFLSRLVRRFLFSDSS
ncbi:MAG: hypothetical protein LGR52_05015 [Candidatus Thiosymbion ectosymbiont of Robbea hypermnestra]|nr:hypothetical protein [Candidatus Thiosymbion ectosymbiont of Robbea hypermnestra]